MSETVTTLSPCQIEMMRHALGLPNAREKSHRNRYSVERHTPDFAAWLTLTKFGLAIWHDMSPQTLDLFTVTEKGAALVIEKSETLDLEDFPDAARI